MGNFIVHVEAVGGHGCQRQIGDSEKVPVCDNPSCPDCIARKFVRSLRDIGADISLAELTHWPGTVGEVKDDLLTGIRKGSF